MTHVPAHPAGGELQQCGILETCDLTTAGLPMHIEFFSQPHPVIDCGPCIDYLIMYRSALNACLTPGTDGGCSLQSASSTVPPETSGFNAGPQLIPSPNHSYLTLIHGLAWHAPQTSNENALVLIVSSSSGGGWGGSSHDRTRYAWKLSWKV